MEIEENLKKIKEQMGNNNVEIIAATKYASDEELLKVHACGIHDFGESYVQDAIKRINRLIKTENQIRWHLIGRLQKNKVKYTVGNFYLIHSVDSVQLAELINLVARKKDIKQKILLQVNILKDPSKAGFSSEEIEKTFGKLIGLPNVEIIGLMTIAPYTNDKSILRTCFFGLANLKEILNKKYMTNIQELSMGMTNDYQIAISHGATMIRLGRAIFGNKRN